MVKTSTKKYTYAVGRRRSAVATVKLFSGKAESTVNGTDVAKYFPGELNKLTYTRPFTVTDTDGKFYFQAKVTGGGTNGQIEALTLSIARALRLLDETAYAATLRAENLLSVDSRVRERRKVGTGGKARRAKQSPKR